MHNTGHSLIKKMRETQAPLAGEMVAIFLKIAGLGLMMEFMLVPDY